MKYMHKGKHKGKYKVKYIIGSYGVEWKDAILRASRTVLGDRITRIFITRHWYKDKPFAVMSDYGIDNFVCETCGEIAYYDMDIYYEKYEGDILLFCPYCGTQEEGDNEGV